MSGRTGPGLPRGVLARSRRFMDDRPPRRRSPGCVEFPRVSLADGPLSLGNESTVHVPSAATRFTRRDPAPLRRRSSLGAGVVAAVGRRQRDGDQVHGRVRLPQQLRPGLEPGVHREIHGPEDRLVQHGLSQPQEGIRPVGQPGPDRRIPGRRSPGRRSPGRRASAGGVGSRRAAGRLPGAFLLARLAPVDRPLRELQRAIGWDVLPDASSISSWALVRSFMASSFKALAPAISSPTRG